MIYLRLPQNIRDRLAHSSGLRIRDLVDLILNLNVVLIEHGWCGAVHATTWILYRYYIVEYHCSFWVKSDWYHGKIKSERLGKWWHGHQHSSFMVPNMSVIQMWLLFGCFLVRSGLWSSNYITFYLVAISNV